MSWCREEDGQVDVLDSSEEEWMEPGYDSVSKGYSLVEDVWGIKRV